MKDFQQPCDFPAEEWQGLAALDLAKALALINRRSKVCISGEFPPTGKHDYPSHSRANPSHGQVYHPSHTQANPSHAHMLTALLPATREFPPISPILPADNLHSTAICALIF